MKKHPLLFNYILFVNKAYIFISITILSLFILTGCNLRINAREEAEDIVATVIEYINKRDLSTYQSLKGLAGGNQTGSAATVLRS